MEATVTSPLDGSVLHRVELNESEGNDPTCCGYSSNGDGFPWLHGAEVLCAMHGAPNVHRWIKVHHLSTNWRKAYEGVSFVFPAKEDVERSF